MRLFSFLNAFALPLVFCGTAAVAQMVLPSADDLKQGLQDTKNAVVDAGNDVKEGYKKVVGHTSATNAPQAAPGSVSAPPPIQLNAAAAPKASEASAPTTLPTVSAPSQATATPPTPANATTTAATTSSPASSIALPPPAALPFDIPNDPAMLPNPGNLTPTPPVVGNEKPVTVPPAPPAVSTVPAVTIAAPYNPDESAANASPSLVSNDSPNGKTYAPTSKARKHSRHAKKKPAAASMVTQAKYKHIRLPDTIYRPRYDRLNKHLPTAVYEHTLDGFLFKAVRQDNLNGLRAMLDYDKRDINTINPEGDSLLVYAIKNRSVNAIALLIGRHADANIRDAGGMTALDIAQQMGMTNVVRLLEARKNMVVLASSDSLAEPKISRGKKHRVRASD